MALSSIIVSSVLFLRPAAAPECGFGGRCLYCTTAAAKRKGQNAQDMPLIFSVKTARGVLQSGAAVVQ
jgi:hypothetical protein